MVRHIGDTVAERAIQHADNADALNRLRDPQHLSPRNIQAGSAHKSSESGTFGTEPLSLNTDGSSVLKSDTYFGANVLS